MSLRNLTFSLSHSDIKPLGSIAGGGGGEMCRLSERLSAPQDGPWSVELCRAKQLHCVRCLITDTRSKCCSVRRVPVSDPTFFIELDRCPQRYELPYTDDIRKMAYYYRLM